MVLDMTGIKDHPREKERALTTNCDKDNIKPLKEKTLSDKRNFFDGLVWHYKESDIKQFIKKLKEDIGNIKVIKVSEGTSLIRTLIYDDILCLIDKEFGDKLV